MDRIRQIQPGQMRLRGRQSRRRDDDSFSDWMGGPKPENENAPAFLMPALTKTTKDAIIISQESGQEYKAASNRKADPYGHANSDRRRIDGSQQYTFAFIRNTSVDEEI